MFFLPLLNGTATAQTAGFSAGVAVGDVTDSAAIFWTRADTPGAVRLELARDAAFQQVEQTAEAVAGTETDLTVKIELTGLTPNSRYFYRFSRTDDPASISRTGRFRVAPAPDQAAAVRFVFSGDSNFAYAPLRVVGAAAEEEADLFIWFGDTIYGDVPADGLGVASTLEDYRAKYLQMRSDPNIQEILARMAVYVGGDDHEVTDDFAGLDPNLPVEQREAGYRAFFEYMPIRTMPAPDDQYREYRRFRYGSQVEFFFLDERRYREPSAEEVCDSSPDPFGVLFGPFWTSPGCRSDLAQPRTMLGDEQYTWLLEGLRTSTAPIKFVVNNVPLSYLAYYPYDRWDGYDNERRGLLEFIDAQNISGVVFLTTDIHANAYNPDVMGYFRARRGDYSLPNGVTVPEIIVGPIGNETQYGTLTGFAEDVLGNSAFVRGLLDGLYKGLVRGLKTMDDLAFVDADRVSYVVVDVAADGNARLAYRGVRGADAPDESRPIETFYEGTVETLPPPPPAASVPCGVPFLLMCGVGYWAIKAAAPRSRRNLPV